MIDISNYFYKIPNNVKNIIYILLAYFLDNSLDKNE